MSLSVILQQMGVICILVIVGIILNNRGVVDKMTSRQLSSIVVDVCNPALILASILSGNITATHHDLLIAAGLGAGFYALLIALGFVLPRVLRVEPDKRRFYNLMTVYTNTGFLGIPVARAVLPNNSILYVIVINVFYSLLFYTHGLAILGNGTKDAAAPGRSILRNILNAGTIMAVLSLVVFWFHITPPPIISNTVQYIGNATVFLSMTLLGVNIARSRLRSHLRDARIWGYILLRMVLFPILAAFAANALGVKPAATLAICLMAAVPIGNLPMIQAEKIGEDTSVLSSAIAVTTAVSMITITVIISAMTAFLAG